MLTVSIGVATTDKRAFQHYAEAVAVATEMKQFTKGSTGSSWAMDRRTAELARRPQVERLAGFGQEEALTEANAQVAKRRRVPRAVSMPSATMTMPISSANEIRAAARARFARSASIPRVRLMSIFTMSGAICRVWRMLANPAPASSIAMRAPISRKGASAVDQGDVVLDRLVLGDLQHDPVGVRSQQTRELGGGGRAMRAVHRQVGAFGHPVQLRAAPARSW